MLKKLHGPGQLRLLLALLVFGQHTTRLSLGSTAVYVFFCLSGYWVFRMYTLRYSATRQPYITFMISRAWRLLPTFWLVTGITLVLVYLEGSLRPYLEEPGHVHALTSNLLIFGYNTLPRRLVGPAWSLDIEMQFYVIAPIIAILLARRVASAISVLLIAIALSSVTFIACHLTQTTIPLPGYLVFFVIGMAASSLAWKPSPRTIVMTLALLLLLIISCLTSPWKGLLLLGAHPGPLATYHTYASILLAILATPYAIYTTSQKGFAMDGMFADLSYVVYLLHWSGVLWIMAHPGALEQKILYTSSVWILVLMLSVIIWKYYDRPINRMRSKWVEARKEKKIPHALETV